MNWNWKPLHKYSQYMAGPSNMGRQVDDSDFMFTLCSAQPSHESQDVAVSKHARMHSSFIPHVVF